MPFIDQRGPLKKRMGGAAPRAPMSPRPKYEGLPYMERAPQQAPQPKMTPLQEAARKKRIAQVKKSMNYRRKPGVFGLDKANPDR